MRWVTLRSFSEGGLASAGSAASVGGATALAVGLHFLLIIAHTIMMTWVYNNTDGNMLLMLLFHASLNVSLTAMEAGQPKWIYLVLTLLTVVTIIAGSGIKDLSKKERTKFIGLSQET